MKYLAFKNIGVRNEVVESVKGQQQTARRTQLCHYKDCERPAQFNYEGKMTRRFCGNHKKMGMVFVKKRALLVNGEEGKMGEAERAAVEVNRALSSSSLLSAPISPTTPILASPVEKSPTEPTADGKHEGRGADSAERKEAVVSRWLDGLEENGLEQSSTVSVALPPLSFKKKKPSSVAVSGPPAALASTLAPSASAAPRVSSKRCRIEDCEKPAALNYPGKLVRKYCFEHRKDGMVYLKTTDHAVPGMRTITGSSAEKKGSSERPSSVKLIDPSRFVSSSGPLYSPTTPTTPILVTPTQPSPPPSSSAKPAPHGCREPNCPKQASYGTEGTLTRQYCSQHKKRGQVNLAERCLVEGCNQHGWFAFEGETDAFCVEHRTDGMNPRHRKWCEEWKCKESPYLGVKKGWAARWCKKHAMPGAVVVFEDEAGRGAGVKVESGGTKAVEVVVIDD